MLSSLTSASCGVWHSTGANAGFSTLLFKLLWPDAVVVAVEPDPGNFQALVTQTRSLQGVHVLNAGLWGRRARIGQTGDHGAWGRVFKEFPLWKRGGMQAYPVTHIAKQFGIEAFDFVKIDIEGAEGQVFAPNADVSWVPHAKVISLEVHDYFAGYFGLEVRCFFCHCEGPAVLRRHTNLLPAAYLHIVPVWCRM